MKILILNWRDTKHPKSGGAEQVTMQHAKGWVRLGHHVVWMTSGYLNVPRDEIVEGVQIIRRGGSLTIYLVAPLYLLYFLIRGVKFDVVVDEIHGIPFFTPLYLPFPKLVFIHEVAGRIWDVMWPFPINIIGKTLERLYFLVYRNVYFWTDAVSTVKELEANGIMRSHCVAIPCPVVLPSQIESKPKEKELTCIFVSRVVKMKGIEDVIMAFTLLCKKHPQAQLWIVGSGEDSYVQELKKLITEKKILQNVTFYGQVTEKEKYILLSRAHILLHASVKEGWGLVVLEAAYQKTPAVVYNVAGLCDTVKNGETGIVVTENTPAKLAEAALDLYQDRNLYAHFQKNGKKFVESLHWDDAVQQSETLLKKVAHA